MSDTLYLSFWYPNLRLAALPDKLVSVLEQFAAHEGEARVYSATVWPVGWSESPVFQQVYGRIAGAGERGAEPRAAVEQALELLHDDYAYEFQIGWSLWELELMPGLEPRWVRAPRLVRVTGFGPLFEEGAPTSRTVTSAWTSATTHRFSKKRRIWTPSAPITSRRISVSLSI